MRLRFEETNPLGGLHKVVGYLGDEPVARIDYVATHVGVDRYMIDAPVFADTVYVPGDEGLDAAKIKAEELVAEAFAQLNRRINHPADTLPVHLRVLRSVWERNGARA